MRHHRLALAIAIALVACGGGGSTGPKPTGSVHASIATTGHQLDPDGYLLHVDTLTRPLPDSGSALLTGLEPGTAEVQVSGIAANCALVGPASRPVTVVADSTTEAALAVTCDSTYGGIRVVVTTTGGRPDSNGYLIKVDTGAATRVADSDSLVVRPLAAGSHTVTLSDVAANCTVGGGASRSVAVSAGRDTTVAIAVSCPAPGAIKLLVTTTGGTPDSNGYLVTVDNGTAVRVADTDSLVFQPLTPGTHSLAVSDVAGNCSVIGGPSRTVSISDGEDTTIAISVSCPTPTTVTVHVATTGTYLDPDGYSVSIDAGTSVPVSDSGSTTPIAVTPGAHTVHVNGVVQNCSVSGGAAQPVSAAAGTDSPLSIAVACSPPPIVFTDVVIVGTSGRASLFLVNPDGSNRTQLTSDSVAVAIWPRWSPDGSSVLFSKNPSDYQYWPVLISAATKHIQVLPLAATPFIALSWFGATHLIGSYFHELPPALPHEVAVVDTAGAGFTQMTFDTLADGSADTTTPGTRSVDYTPTNGGRIAFERLWCVSSVCNVRLWTQPAAVSAALPLTDSLLDATSPAWSPDGSRIAYESGADIYVINADGTGRTQLTHGGGLVRLAPRWSPQGDRIIYSACVLNCGIYMVDVSTGVETEVTPIAQTIGSIEQADWRWTP